MSHWRSKGRMALATLAVLVATATLLPAAPPAFGAPAGGDATAGEKVFAQCKACHKIDAAAKPGIGPNLNGVVGRRAGTVPGFRYSPAMVANGKVWTVATIDAYLAAPAKAIPGNRMAFVGLRNPADRRNVIAYLKSASQ